MIELCRDLFECIDGFVELHRREAADPMRPRQRSANLGVEESNACDARGLVPESSANGRGFLDDEGK